MPNSILDREQYGLGGLGSSLSKLGKKAIKKIDYDQVKQLGVINLKGV